MIFSRSPQLTDAIAAVCREPATKIVSSYPDLDYDQVVGFFNTVTQFLRENSSQLGSRQFLIRPHFNNEGNSLATPLTLSSLIDTLNSGATVISIDGKFCLIGIDKTTLSLSGISAYSIEHDCCLFHIHNGIEIIVYAKGCVLKEINLLAPMASPFVRKRFARPANAYCLAIIDHYHQRIRYGGLYSDHWEDREHRILRNPPQKTERIFHVNLQNWLDENLDGASVLGKVKKISDDETDIEIRVHSESNIYYIVEVKWLGTNGSTTFSESRLRDGIKQVNEYLQRNPETSEVCLVAYDGRTLAKFDELTAINGETEQWKEISGCQTESLLQRGKGLVFFLESHFASGTRPA
jgi:hypothetical protein